MSGRRSRLFSTTVNWLTASQSFASGVSKSTTRTCAPRTVPSGSTYSTVTPSTSMRWKARLRASTVAPVGRISRRCASCERIVGKARIEPGERGSQATVKHDLCIVGAFSRRRVRRDVRAMDDGPTEPREPLEGDGFNSGLGDPGWRHSYGSSGVS